MGASQPVYRKIEFVRSPKALWGKLESGRWDWLGVHPDGQFVLGSPPASRITDSVAIEVTRAGVDPHGHAIRLSEPNSPRARVEPFASEEEAIQAYRNHVDDLTRGGRDRVPRAAARRVPADTRRTQTAPR